MMSATIGMITEGISGKVVKLLTPVSIYHASFSKNEHRL